MTGVSEDDQLFSDDFGGDSDHDDCQPWKILVVDDEPDVHVVTRAVLRGCRFLDRPILLLEAGTAVRARALLDAHPDIAVAILDVVMETDDAGIGLIGTIRDDLKRRALRIVMRTGQPGLAPEREVIERYEISDYRLKSDLTAAALYTSVIVALRWYHEIFCRCQAEEFLRQAKEIAERAELQSKNEERRFRDFAEASADLFWETDAAKHVTFFSRYEAFIDSTPISGTLPFDVTRLGVIIQGDGRENWSLILDALDKKRAFRSLEISFRNLAGDCRYFSFTGVPCFDDFGHYQGHRGTSTDVTERRRSEFALRAREKAEAAEAVATAQQRRFQDFAASSADWYWESDEAGRVTYHFQPNSTVIHPPLFLKALERFFHEQNDNRSALNQQFWADYRALLNGRQAFRDLEFGLEFGDGDNRYLTVSGVPAYDPGGHYIGYRGTTRDVTARKQAEVALSATNEHLQRTLIDLRKTQNQLVHAEKMTALGQLVAGVAHEVNNPLGFVIANLESLDELVKDVFAAYKDAQESFADSASPHLLEKWSEIQARYDINFIIEDIGALLPSSLAGLDRIAQIIKHLRQFSRSDEGSSRRESLKDLILINLELVKRQLGEKNVKIICDVPVLPAVECHPGEMNQVIMNLIVNAEHAMPQGGTLTITGRREGDRYVRIEFCDTGLGIPNDIIDKIFEPFFTTKPVGKGTGLGLSITYGIITNRHGGTIDVKSEVGKGTVFTIIVPIDLPIGTK